MKKILLVSGKLLPTPILLGFSYILTLYLHNIGELTLSVLPVPMLMAIAVVFVLSLAGYAICKNSIKTSVFVSVLTVLFYSYGDVTSFIGGRVIFWEQGVHYLTAALYVCVIAVLFLVIRHTRKYIGQAYQYLFLFAGFAVCLPLAGIVRYEVTQRVKTEVHSHFRIPEGNVQAGALSDMPDIYYIVPDSYSSAGTMKKYFGYDDIAFIDYLRQKGFYVADDATSNYPKTYLSLPSTLNMEYLDYLSVYSNSSDETLIDPLIKDNSVLLFLKKQGYTYYQLGSWWGPTQYNRLATRNYNLDLQNPLGINAFDTLIIEASLIKSLMPPSVFGSVVTESVEDKRRRILYQFDTLKTVAQLPGPKFVFAHIIAPHGPNVFGEHCEFITQDSLVGLTDEEGYTNQVHCINIKLTETIDAIIRSSKRPPVILLQADEGAPFLAQRLTPADSWGNADSTMLKEKFPILSAYYFPEGDYASLYPAITPVNSFRVILNKIFTMQIPLLPDRNYINLDMNHAYEYRDVTGTLKE